MLAYFLVLFVARCDLRVARDFVDGVGAGVLDWPAAALGGRGDLVRAFFFAGSKSSSSSSSNASNARFAPGPLATSLGGLRERVPRREQSAQGILNSKQRFLQESKSDGIRRYVRVESDNGTEQKVRLL